MPRKGHSEEKIMYELRQLREENRKLKTLQVIF